MVDCYLNKREDEPAFTLLGRDKHAAALVRLWAEIREREGEDQTSLQDARLLADQLEQYAAGLSKPVLSLDALISFATIYKGKQEAKRQEEQAKHIVEQMAVKWNIGDHAMTIHSRHIGNIETMIDESKPNDVPKHPKLANVRYSPTHMMTIPIESLRKPTDEELAEYFQQRGIR